MRTVHLSSEDVELEFHAAKRAADARADEELGENVCLSWYDKGRDHECPAHASECHDGACEIPGFIEYATSRGAELQVVVGDGDFAFCYRPLGEFADL